MRIAFLGKGGVGKTTTAAGFIRYAAGKHPFVLAIDADVNAHMRQALNIEQDIVELGGEFQAIVDYLRGVRTDLNSRPMIGTTPPSLKSNFVRVSPNDPLISKYAIKNNNLSLLTVGTYHENDIGSSCYHTKLASLASLVHHLLDTENDIVIADTTAGTDNVATSLNFAYDLNVFVIEPTEKSVRVYQDYVQLAPHLAERTFVIANKVEGEEDKSFLTRNIREDKILGSIPFSHHLKRFEQGHKGALLEFQAEQEQAFETVYEKLQNKKRDWHQYLDWLKGAHEKVCRDWYNVYYGTQLDTDLDSDFSYERALALEESSVTLISTKEPVALSANSSSN